jgi:hypothetical protein
MTIDIDAFWSLLDEFGFGSLTAHTRDGLRSRPIEPVIDRARNELCCIADAGWLPASGSYEIDASIVLLNEHTRRGLAVQGRLRQSRNRPDVETAWTTLAGHRFPDGPGSPGVIALRISPVSAAMWDLLSGTRTDSWLLNGDGIIRC